MLLPGVIFIAVDKSLDHFVLLGGANPSLQQRGVVRINAGKAMDILSITNSNVLWGKLRKNLVEGWDGIVQSRIM